MSIKRLKSRGSPPWGCILLGNVTPLSTGATVAMNFVVRFFTPNTTTEVGKVCVPGTSVDVHLVDDTTNTITAAVATDQTTVNTLLNDIKAKYNAHRVSTTFHSVADNTNAVTSADASDLATSITLANEIKADYNAHRLQATIHPYNESRNITTSPDGTDLATTITLANEERNDYSAHRIANTLSFTVYGITPGTYDVGIKVDFACSLLIQDVVFTAGNTTKVNFGLMYVGDVFVSDAINLQDSTALLANVGAVGDCVGYPGNWQVPEMNTFGDWSVIPTARRKTY